MNSHPSPIGESLRHARGLRHWSQMELALRLGVSQRHISFVESGRARPSRALLLDWMDALDVALAQRNTLLQQAGFAPSFSQASLADPQMASVLHALESLLQTHDPMPALVIGPQWDLLQLNQGALWLAQTLVPNALADASVGGAPNMLDLLLHPAGLLCPLLNKAEAGADFLAQLRADLADQPALTERVEALAQRLAPHGDPRPRSTPVQMAAPVLTLRFASDHGELAFFRMFSTFGSPRDITVASLRVEHLFAADAHTQEVLQVQVPRK